MFKTKKERLEAKVRKGINKWIAAVNEYDEYYRSIVGTPWFKPDDAKLVKLGLKKQAAWDKKCATERALEEYKDLLKSIKLTPKQEETVVYMGHFIVKGRTFKQLQEAEMSGPVNSLVKAEILKKSWGKYYLTETGKLFL